MKPYERVEVQLHAF